MFKKIIIICFFTTFFSNHGYAAEKPYAAANDDVIIYHSLFKYNNALRPSDNFLRYLGIDPQTIPDTVFHTDKVYLRLIDSSDKDAFINLHADKQYMKYFPGDLSFLSLTFDKINRFKEKAESGIISFENEHKVPLVFMVCRLTDGAVVGAIGVSFIKPLFTDGNFYYTASFGGIVDKAHSGIGYFSDTLKIITNITKNIPYLACGCAQVVPENKASIKALQNNGFKYSSTQEKYPNDPWTGLNEYSLAFDKFFDDHCGRLCRIKQDLILNPTQLEAEHLKEEL